MKIAVISIGRSGSSELIKLLKPRLNVIPKKHNHLYPKELFNKHGRNIKVIFITRNINDVIGSVLQREKDKGIKWIRKHYKNLKGNFSKYGKILQKDTLHFEKLYDSYNKQNLFDVLFIKYECLYFNHQATIDAVCNFTKLTCLTIHNNPNNKWKGKYDKKKTLNLLWDKSLQTKLDSYDFKLHNKQLIKIAHLINPFKCAKDNPSYLYYAQPITFKSMFNAQVEGRKTGLNIKLYAANYPEDDDIIPKYFIKLPHLKQSTITEFPEISGTRKLPIIQEMFNSILENSDADYIIFSNSDIGVQKNFYNKVTDYIYKHNLKSFVINRRDNIPKFKHGKRLTEQDLNIIYKEKGKIHPGKDCFIIKRNILEKININLIFTGYPPWGKTLVQILNKLGKTHIFEKEFLTFHLGCDKVWKKKNNKNPLWLKNIELSKKC